MVYMCVYMVYIVYIWYVYGVCMVYMYMCTCMFILMVYAYGVHDVHSPEYLQYWYVQMYIGLGKPYLFPA
jgi:hypothetical protein